MKARSSLTGFTFIELLAVVLIISLVAAAASPVFNRALRTERLNSGCRQLASFITMLQAECVLNAREVRMIYNVEQGSYTVVWAGETSVDPDDMTEGVPTSYLPDDVTFADISLNPYDTFAAGEVEIRFQRDGWVTPHLIHLSVENMWGETRMRTLEIIPLTGQVKVHAEEVNWEDLAL